MNFHGSCDEIGRLAAMFDRMLDRSFWRQRQFTADASKELNTPLTNLASHIDAALDQDRTPAEYQQLLGNLRKDAERMTQQVGELLTHARAGA